MRGGIGELKEKIQKYLDSLTDEEFEEVFSSAGFEVLEGSGKIIFTDEQSN